MKRGADKEPQRSLRNSLWSQLYKIRNAEYGMTSMEMANHRYIRAHADYLLSTPLYSEEPICFFKP